MVWQETAALSIVGLTGVAFVWRALRSRRFQNAEATPCMCGNAGQANRGPSVTYRARKGERPQIVVRYK